VVAVVVAYNRSELLRSCLDALASQSMACERVVVVDNASTDDSVAVATAHPVGADVVALTRNTGGAGGFAAGIAHAMAAHAPDLLWLLDDDTIPTPTALAGLVDAVEAFPGRVALAGSRVLWGDGRDHPMNTPRRRPRVSETDVRRAAVVEAMPVRSSSFVSMLVTADAVRTHGLPLADYFIWNDDFEYSCRLLRREVGLAVPASVVEHRTKTFGATDADPGERFFYEVRNKVWMLTRSSSLGPGERVLYLGASLRRWARTVRRSQARSVLLKAGTRGLGAGLRRGPRPTSEVLAGLGSVSDDVAGLEAVGRA
jgi:rhamnopyranosyl-N-acetylglucosaminyl-diphospho-decaprenol beta-1,3/1,4-galactofuranosyltransferase